jgi:hypothetical protein
MLSRTRPEMAACLSSLPYHGPAAVADFLAPLL